MSDFTCPECHVTSDYYETRKTLDPRMLPKCRTICQNCADRIDGVITAPGGPYDGRVGSKGGGASALAAAEIAEKVGPLRMACLNYVIEFGPTGADDMAQALGQLWGNIRPRCAELTKPEHFSLFEKGPMTALTYCGKAQHVYQLSDAGRAYAQRRAA